MKTPSLKTLALVATAGLTLAACATATPYQPAGFNGQRNGYAEQRLESNRFRVSFSGNSLTSREQVEMSLLLRSAEVAAENGYDSTPDPFYDRFYGPRFGPYWSPSWRFYRRGYWSPWGPTWGNDFDVRQVDRYEANAEIILGRGPKPAGDPNAFDAREVIQNLGPRVTRPS